MIENKTSQINPLTVKQLAAKYPAFTEGGLRHLIFHADKNGFKRCIRRVGSKILILEHVFFEYIDAQKTGGNHAAN